MNEIAKKSAIERLKKAMDLERLKTSEVSKLLNLNPCYISMSLNEKHWSSMSSSAWDRILLWCNSGETLRHFKIPNGEPVWESSKKAKKQGGIVDKVKIEETIALLRKEEKADEIIKESAEKENINELKQPVIEHILDQDKKPSEEHTFIDTARLKVALDIEINLLVNGQKVQLR